MERKDASWERWCSNGVTSLFARSLDLEGVWHDTIRESDIFEGTMGARGERLIARRGLFL